MRGRDHALIHIFKPAIKLGSTITIRPILFLFLCLFLPCCERPVATNDAAALLRPLKLC